MQQSNLIPTSLKVVAVLFILTGITSLIDVVVSLANGRIDIDFGVLGLFVGSGLLRLSQAWRTVGLVLLVISAIGVAIVALAFLTAPGPLDFSAFGVRVGQVSKELGLGLAVILFALVVWQLRVLTSEEVRDLFETAQDERL